ncbi:adenylate kinase [Candidatus Micrarchaeota archaeon]|nr:adenylate kinase [Candidatus Micrarchaeota archaeon]
MRILLLGPPGAGKGTQAKLLKEKLSIPHISTGQIFRKEMADKTELGLFAKQFIDKGELVPDQIVVDIVRERLGHDDCNEGFILDGFPRTETQAVELDALLTEMNLKLQAVINISIPEEVLVHRLSDRFTCKECDAIYNEKVDKCIKCGGDIYTRADDSPQVVRERLQVYNNRTQPILNYYARQNRLQEVNGNQTVEEVLQEIMKIITKH